MREIWISQIDNTIFFMILCGDKCNSCDYMQVWQEGNDYYSNRTVRKVWETI